MTTRKSINPDAITPREAAKIHGVAVRQIPKLIHDGLLDRVGGQHPSLSRAQVEERARNPRQTAWVNVTEAARILGSSKTRLGQISDKGPLPFETSKSGRRHRRYRLGRLCCVVRSRAMPRRDLGPVMVR